MPERYITPQTTLRQYCGPENLWTSSAIVRLGTSAPPCRELPVINLCVSFQRRLMLRPVLAFCVTFTLLGCYAAAQSQVTVQLTLDTSEADQALQILGQQKSHTTVTDGDWQRLFGT